MSKKLFYISMMIAFAAPTMGKAACLACQCGNANGRFPVATLDECYDGCAGWGIVCTNEAQKLRKKVHVTPAVGKQFDYACYPGVNLGGGKITGKLAADQCGAAQ